MSTYTQALNKDRLYKVVHIREAENPTVHKPIVSTMNSSVKICLKRARLVTESYMSTEGQPWILRRAKALDHLLCNMSIFIIDGEQIVGNYASDQNSICTYPEFSHRWLEEGLKNEFKDALDEKGKKALKELHSYWEGKNVESVFMSVLPEDLKPYLGWTGCFFGPWLWPLGLVMPNYKDRAFKMGLKGILEEIGHYRGRMSKFDPEYSEKKDFYDAAEITCKAVIAFAKRYAQLAWSEASRSSGKTKQDYLNIYEVCSRVPENPPQTFHEALQTFFFHHLITTQIDYNGLGLGQRFDQLFYPYYIRDKQEGRITYDRAVELFEFLWIKLDDLGQISHYTDAMLQVGGTKFQNVTVGGVDENGNDASNELSHAVIQATMNIRTLQPAIVMRYHDKIEPALVDKAIDCIATGIGMPSIFNDKAAIPWHFNTSLIHFYPRAGKRLGVHPLLLALYQKAAKAKTLNLTKSFAKAIFPKVVTRRMESVFHNWSYKLATGGGFPGAVLRGALKATGIVDTPKVMRLARDWSSAACVGGGLKGITLQGLFTLICAGTLNYLKCFEYVLYQGVEPSTGEQLGASTPDPTTFRTYDDFLNAYLAQVKFAIETMARIYAINERLYAKMTPRPFASILMDSPIELGRDASHKADFGYSEIFSMASVNTADALASIKKLVFEERSVSMKTMVEACKNNWQGHEDIKRMCLNVPKFGNDDDYVDLVLADLYEKISRTAKSVKDHFGKPFSPEATLAGGYFAGGLSCGATPDGRSARETVSDGQISPMQGRDINGPTAVLKSVSKVDPTRTWNQLLNQKMLPHVLRGKHKKLFANYLRTWAGFGNWHIQFNCIDNKILEDAQQHPEKHRDLIVRVAGYSSFFVELTPGLQKDIIRRTAHDLS